MKLEIITYKTEFGDWAFDHEHQNTVEEPLCNGTELVMDEYFEIDMKRKPVPGDQMYVIVDTENFKDSDTVLSFQSTSAEGTVYLDMVLFEEVWLCPWLQSYFGHVPSELYVQLNPVNPGKIAFEKTMRTGVNPFTKYLKTSSFNENVSGIPRECSNC
ncbi:hypothetical protein PQC13_gp166 [Synechococcus phage S-SRM01]|uniref:Uncharacterized protein n=1 Tax=Synechococcus phage S-SRM01 TaxID=2781608 RepID=A0A879R2C0_9CAUD|nr:hypothetical protein PQC13_gp166 [Synechococcus phage S-SRM01]QPX48131.1 hypothetical protein [Synechococcus phage S-SRM01]